MGDVCLTTQLWHSRTEPPPEAPGHTRVPRCPPSWERAESGIWVDSATSGRPLSSGSLSHHGLCECGTEPGALCVFVETCEQARSSWTPF